MLTPTKLRDAALEVLEQALKSENWKEQLGAARIVLSKVEDGETADGLDVFEFAMKRHDERQKQREMPDAEEEAE